MEKLIKMALDSVDEAEVYSYQEENNRVRFENSKFYEVDSQIVSGTGIRVIKDGKMGSAYVTHLNDKKALLVNALNSLKGGSDAPLAFASPGNHQEVSSYNPSIESASTTLLADEGKRVCEKLQSMTNGNIEIYAEFAKFAIQITNSRSLDLSHKGSYYFFAPMISYPNTRASIHRSLEEKSFKVASDDLLEFLAEIYLSSEKLVEPISGKMKVLFMPESMYTLIWRVSAATNASSIYYKSSPLLDRVGETIFDKCLTIYNDPTDERMIFLRSFDDEGVPCRHHEVITNGAFKGIHNNLYFAGKLGSAPSGHGFKNLGSMGEIIAFPPVPALLHLIVEPGNASFGDMVNSMDKGIIVAGCMGGHSGNLEKGDFSVGVSPGFYVKNGKILGHVKNTMVSGNIYETFNNIIEIENAQHNAYRGIFPAVLFDNVEVAGD